METEQLYSYVGPEEIIKRINKDYTGQKVNTPIDILQWIADTNQQLSNHSITVTFIINEYKELLISDRHSEHVMCANGEKVFSAGEMTFIIDKQLVYISEISNQSTGYCPQPASWKTVAEVIQKLDIGFPKYFTNAYEFRYCPSCQNINLIKEDIYECAICDSELDLVWNFPK